MTSPAPVEMRQLFCSKPFEWFEVQHFPQIGDVYLCCPSWLEGPVGNLAGQSLDEVWNGEKARELRRSILDGSFRYCDAVKCPFLKTVTGPVKPRDRVVAPHLRRVIDEGLTRLPFAPAVINCSHDRSCNLACPSCRTEVLIQRNHQDAILAIQDRINDEALQHAKQLYITGSGDPFGSPYFRRWLQEMRLEDAPQLTSIHLHSNAQMWTPRIWETIDPEIRNLIRTTEISVDAATPETYAINRWPGDFKRLLENLEFIVSLRRNGPLRDVVLSMVVQENNFREMPGFIELGKRVGVDRVVFSQITNWGTFSEDDFTTRAVHSPSHPRHQEFRTMLAAPLFASHFVFLGNLADLRST